MGSLRPDDGGTEGHAGVRVKPMPDERVLSRGRAEWEAETITLGQYRGEEDGEERD